MTAMGTMPVLLGTGIHGSRPAASAVGKGGLYSCTTHSLVYQTDGSSWTTWATLGSSGSGSITASGYTQATARLLGRSTASTGAIEEISVGSGLTLAAGSLSASGGGGAAVSYGSLKPGTPTYDFSGSDLAGATAVSNTGTFGTGNCHEGALDGSHLSIGLQAQSGFLYWGVSNVDMTVTCGGMHATLGDNQSYMMGIAVLNSSNTGVGIIVYNDGNAYLASITAGVYSGILQTITGYGHGASGVQPASASRYNFRINRSTNSWTGQVSVDGSNWITASSSSSVTITAARVAAGVFFDASAAYKGRVFLDWLNVA